MATATPSSRSPSGLRRFLRKHGFKLYVVTVVMAALLAIEFVCMQVNRANGVHLPFLARGGSHVLQTLIPQHFTRLDPHLGYAHGSDESGVKALIARGHRWRSGFAIYGQAAEAKTLLKPVILTLGGSTTDPVQYGRSWPEELHSLLQERRIPATVINGGTGGYSSNQELLKLIRDGLEFKPDIVVTFNGVNDGGNWGVFPHPMVHPYQRRVLDSATHPAVAPLFPNTVRVLQAALKARDERQVTGATMGLKTAKTRGEWYVRNLALIEALCRANGVRYFAIVQPTAFVGGYDGGPKFNEALEKLKQKEVTYGDHIRFLQAAYRDLQQAALPQPYVYDFTRIFHGEHDVYLRDGIHATRKGNRIIAQRVYDLLADDLAASH